MSVVGRMASAIGFVNAAGLMREFNAIVDKINRNKEVPFSAVSAAKSIGLCLDVPTNPSATSTGKRKSWKKRNKFDQLTQSRADRGLL